MKLSNRTKQLLADGLKEMTETTPFERIRVSELCRRCGVDRRTFYYHFRDVYDLAAWIFNRMVEDCLTERDGHFDPRELVGVMNSLYSDPTFYRSALAEDSQNALGRHVIAHNVAMYEAAARKLRGTETLPLQDVFAIRYHSIGSVIMIRHWRFGNLKASPEEMTQLLLGVMPPIMAEIYSPAPPEKGEQNDA